MRWLARIAVLTFPFVAGCNAVNLEIGSRDEIRYTGVGASFWIATFEKSAGGIAPDRNAEAVRALVHLAPSSAKAREYVRTLLEDQDDRLFDSLCEQFRAVPGCANLFHDELLEAVLWNGPRADDALRTLLNEAVSDSRGYEALESTLRTELVTLDPALADALNEYAWQLVDPEDEHGPDPRAVFLARCAVWLDRRKSANVLNTLAWALYWNDERAEAIEVGKESLAKLPADYLNRAAYEAAQRRFEAP